MDEAQLASLEVDDDTAIPNVHTHNKDCCIAWCYLPATHALRLVLYAAYLRGESKMLG